MSQTMLDTKSETLRQYVEQAEKLSSNKTADDVLNPNNGSTAVEAKFVTPLDAVVEVADGNRLPAVPPEEAAKLNLLKNRLIGERSREGSHDQKGDSESKIGAEDAQPRPTSTPPDYQIESGGDDAGGKLDSAMPPNSTHPLFPPLPLYGPPSRLRDLQCIILRLSSFFLSSAFILVILMGTIFENIPLFFRRIFQHIRFENPYKMRPFYYEEQRRELARQEAADRWAQEQERTRRKKRTAKKSEQNQANESECQPRSRRKKYQPTEGGPDELVCDVGYYARRVGLDCEEFEVQTEDGFVIKLWHIYDPSEYQPRSPRTRQHRSPKVFADADEQEEMHQRRQYQDGSRRYPVLMIHGLLQSSGAYCANDDHSLAFYLCKSGYDVWLGNNRCGFQHKHVMLDYYDPRMWAWNIRQMGVMDLTALISRVLHETGFKKVGLVCHSQGTTLTFVSLAKKQRPDLGEKISVFCALAPAAYSGPLIGKMCFKFMRIISPSTFRIFFGIHAFVPEMMMMHGLLPGRLWGLAAYLVFAFMFGWSDLHWDRGLRDRLFQFSPVYVSAESMRWWLGRECFARHKCILATREDKEAEEAQDERLAFQAIVTAREAEGSDDDDDDDDNDSDDESADGGNNSAAQEESFLVNGDVNGITDGIANRTVRSTDHKSSTSYHSKPGAHNATTKQPSALAQRKARRCWFDEHCPPMAFWIAGRDNLVDGRRLLRRFHTGREPHVNLVHAKVIEEYEHLDVLWAMDVIDTVGKELRDVIWKTASEEDRKICRVPGGWSP